VEPSRGAAVVKSIDDIAKNLIMVAVVFAVIGFSGYLLLHDPNGDAAKTLLGPVIMAFGLIANRLFGQPPTP